MIIMNYLFMSTTNEWQIAPDYDYNLLIFNGLYADIFSLKHYMFHKTLNLVFD